MKRTWIVDYVVGNWHKSKRVLAETAAEAIKKARVKNIEDLFPEDERVNDKYLLRDF